MSFFGFLFATIVFLTTGSVVLAFVAWRVAWKAGKRLLGWARERYRLPGDSRPARPVSQEARDVVVEPVDDAPSPEPEPVHRAYERLDVDQGATAADITRVMRTFAADPAVGTHAQAVIDTLESAELRRQSLFAELDATFERTSLSWDRFAAPARAGLDAILRNAALLANRIQSFDSARYLRLRREAAASDPSAPGGLNGSRAEHLRQLEETLASLDAIQETNESLLLELDRLAAELVTLSASGPTERGDRIVEEIRRLVEEARYYR